MKVLIVEDDPSIREGMAELVGELADVRAEGTVEGGLGALKATAYDLVITDLRIGTDRDGGKKLVVAARRYLSPVVIISAMNREDVLQSLGGLLPDGILPKPFQLDEVLDTAEKFLSRRREADRYASLRAELSQATFTKDPSGLELAPVQHVDDREVWWFRAPSGTQIERTPHATELSVIVEGRVDLQGTVREAGQALHAAAGAPVQWTAPSGVLGVSIVFRR